MSEANLADYNKIFTQKMKGRGAATTTWINMAISCLYPGPEAALGVSR